MSTILQDEFGRKFPYLRLSITDQCNFRCGYCLPDGFKKDPAADYLRVDEIERLVRALAGLGMWKIRLTGGEPTIRPDFLEIAERVANTRGIRKVALTTNGYQLPKRVNDYKTAGITSLNISIDSLNPQKFHHITGHDRLPEIMQGIDKAIELGFDAVKINAVLLRGQNDDELESMIAWAQEKPIHLRFIELMQTGENKAFFDTHRLDAAHVKNHLEMRGWLREDRVAGAGPAQLYSRADALGKIGVIAPYSPGFCQSCNRLRVTARGQLRLCLFGENGYDLRPWLQADSDEENLQEKMQSLLAFKTQTHALHEGKTGLTPHLAALGG